MSKESMARITSPEAIARRKANPWTLARREEFLQKQTNEDVQKKREIFDQLNQAREEADALEHLHAIENQATKGKNHVNSNNDSRGVRYGQINQPTQPQPDRSFDDPSNQKAAAIPF